MGGCDGRVRWVSLGLNIGPNSITVMQYGMAAAVR
jgi:hypothetical protein